MPRERVKQIAPQSDAARDAVRLFRERGGTLLEMGDCVGCVARTLGVAHQTAEKFFLRWIVYPFAVAAEPLVPGLDNLANVRDLAAEFGWTDSEMDADLAGCLRRTIAQFRGNKCD